MAIRVLGVALAAINGSRANRVAACLAPDA